MRNYMTVFLLGHLDTDFEEMSDYSVWNYHLTPSVVVGFHGGFETSLRLSIEKVKYLTVTAIYAVHQLSQSLANTITWG